MALRTPIGEQSTGLLLLLLSSFGPACSQSTPLFCLPSAVPTLVRTEGLAERMGDIVLNCSGGTPGAVINVNLTIFLSVNVTNRLADNNVVDTLLTVDTGSGPVPSNVPGQLAAPNAVAYNGLSFTIPASARLSLRLTNLRGAANLVGVSGSAPILAFLATNPSTVLTTTSNQVTVGLPSRGLLATFSSTGVRCTGSPLPQTINLTSLFATGTRFFSTRVTEGSAQAFVKKDALSDSGVRIVARYSGFPAAARLFVPDVVAGSNAVQPTAGGDLGVPPSGGQYAPGGRGSLLLTRVLGTDSSGAGGNLVYTPGPPGSGTVAFNSTSEVPLSNGAGMVVYEVVDSDPALLESAQFPTFLGLPPFSDGASVVAREELSLGPISTVSTASATAPIPRFVAVQPPSDCTALQDCDASYFPRLLVDAPPLQFSGTAGVLEWQPKYIRVNNLGGGFLNWTAAVDYRSGSGWLAIDPTSGLNNATIRVDAHAERLNRAGTYEATIIVDAGPLAGSKSLPVTFTVAAAPPPPPQPTVVVTSILNAASLEPGPMAPGALIALKGTKLAGQNVSVTFDGVPAVLLYVSESQINLQVPPELASKTSAQLVVTVDGEKSAPQTVALAPVSPAVFNPGILNQDNTVNSVSNSAAAGSTIQIFATGVIPVSGGAVSVRINDREIFAPPYAGAAPGLTGVQQVNVVAPLDLGAMTTDLRLCALNPAGAVCSPPVKITLK
jgi:uncharacterized protein (TIGR03437 family)